MKHLQRKLSSTWALPIIPFLVGFGLFFSSATLAEQPASTLEEQIRQMEEEIQLLHRELIQVREKVRESTQQAAQIEGQAANLEKAESIQGHMFFVRGGYAQLHEPRTGQVLTDLGAGTNRADSGWWL